MFSYFEVRAALLTLGGDVLGRRGGVDRVGTWLGMPGVIGRREAAASREEVEWSRAIEPVLSRLKSRQGDYKGIGN